MLFSGSQPIETGWFICFGIGWGMCLFRELREGLLTRLVRRIAQYSYGIYLLHYFAMWVGFVVYKGLNIALQFTIFVVTLVSLSVILFHTVESPLIAAGGEVSRKLRLLRFPPWKVLATDAGLHLRR